MNFITISIMVLGILAQACFIVTEHKERYLSAVFLKGAASACFCLLGYIAHSFLPTAFSRLIVLGLVCGMLGDILLNLRFVFEKKGQTIFLIGIFVFLIGHVLYLVALIPQAKHLLIDVLAGAILAAILLAYIFRTMEVKTAFKIFGVFYLGAIIIMCVIALDIALFVPSTANTLYALGAVLFCASDIILIFNTFSGVTTYPKRIANLSLYYLGQLLIALQLYLR